MSMLSDLPELTTSPLGGRKRFECQVIGLPRPSVRWFKDGVDISDNGRYTYEYTPDGFVNLTIAKVTPRDQGVYSCLAENSEGAAETSASLIITGVMSEEDEDVTSVHKMSRFRPWSESEDDASSISSQRRPLLLGSQAGSTDEEDIRESSPTELGLRRVNLREQSDSDPESIEKGILESKLTKKSKSPDEVKLTVKVDTDNDATNNAGTKPEIEVDLTAVEEDESVIGDMNELAVDDKSGRRLTTDSGFGSRASSFSSDADIGSMTDEDMQEMKEYLHGKAESIFQPLEGDKLKALKTDMKLEKAKTGESVLANQQEMTVSKATTESLANPSLEKTEWDRINEEEARKLAGKYLFDTVSKDEVNESRHGLPELEILMRKEAAGEEKFALDGSPALSSKDVDISTVEESTSRAKHGEDKTTDTKTAKPEDSVKTVEKLNALNAKVSVDTDSTSIETDIKTVESTIDDDLNPDMAALTKHIKKLENKRAKIKTDISEEAIDWDQFDTSGDIDGMDISINTDESEDTDINMLKLKSKFDNQTNEVGDKAETSGKHNEKISKDKDSKKQKDKTTIDDDSKQKDKAVENDDKNTDSKTQKDKGKKEDESKPKDKGLNGDDTKKSKDKDKTDDTSKQKNKAMKDKHVIDTDECADGDVGELDVDIDLDEIEDISIEQVDKRSKQKDEEKLKVEDLKKQIDNKAKEDESKQKVAVLKDEESKPKDKGLKTDETKKPKDKGPKDKRSENLNEELGDVDIGIDEIDELPMEKVDKSKQKDEAKLKVDDMKKKLDKKAKDDDKDKLKDDDSKTHKDKSKDDDSKKPKDKLGLKDEPKDKSKDDDSKKLKDKLKDDDSKKPKDKLIDDNSKKPEDKLKDEDSKKPKDKSKDDDSKKLKDKLKDDDSKKPKDKLKDDNSKKPEDKLKDEDSMKPRDKDDDSKTKPKDKLKDDDSKKPNDKLSDDDSKKPNDKLKDDDSKKPKDKLKDDDSKKPKDKLKDDDSKKPKDKLKDDDSKKPKDKLKDDDSKKPKDKLKDDDSKTTKDKLGLKDEQNDKSKDDDSKKPKDKLKDDDSKTTKDKLGLKDEQNDKSKDDDSKKPKDKLKDDDSKTTKDKLGLKDEQNDKSKDDDSKKPKDKLKDDDSKKQKDQLKDEDSKKPKDKLKDDDSKKPEDKLKDDDSKKPKDKLKDDDSKKPQGKSKDDDSKKPKDKLKDDDSKKPKDKSKHDDSKKPEDKLKDDDSKKPKDKLKDDDSKKPEDKLKDDDSKKPEDKLKDDDSKKPKDKLKDDDSKNPKDKSKDDDSKKPEDKSKGKAKMQKDKGDESKQQEQSLKVDDSKDKKSKPKEEKSKKQTEQDLKVKSLLQTNEFMDDLDQLDSGFSEIDSLSLEHADQEKTSLSKDKAKKSKKQPKESHGDASIVSDDGVSLREASEIDEPGVKTIQGDIEDYLVSIADTQPAIPNVVNISDGFKDNSVNDKEPSRAAELEHIPHESENFDDEDPAVCLPQSFEAEDMKAKVNKPPKVKTNDEEARKVTKKKKEEEQQVVEEKIEEKKVGKKKQEPDIVEEEVAPKRVEKKKDESKQDKKGKEPKASDKDGQEEPVKVVEEAIEPKQAKKKTEDGKQAEKKDDKPKPVEQKDVSEERHEEPKEEVKAKSPTPVKKTKDTHAELLTEEDDLTVEEGEPIELKWHITGVPLSNVNIYKNGKRLLDRHRVALRRACGIVTMVIAGAEKSDAAVYTIRVKYSDVDQGEAAVNVVPVGSLQANEEPTFIVEPAIDMSNTRRLSVKCAVTGFPAPDVTWYYHGKPLDKDALCSAYTKDGYHYLDVNDPSFLVDGGDEIVCKVENEAGFIKRLVTFGNKNKKKDKKKVAFQDEINLSLDTELEDTIHSKTDYSADVDSVDSVPVTSLRKDASSIKIDDSCINVETDDVQVASLDTDSSSKGVEKPEFLLEPEMMLEDGGRRLSIKCAVTGFPAPEVTWYCHGQPLDKDALCSAYSKDGYHYLDVGDASFFDDDEIVCRVENEAGFIHRVLASNKQDKGRISVSPVSDGGQDVLDSAPVIQLEVCEINTENLLQTTACAQYTDRLNLTTVDKNEALEVLSVSPEPGILLARNTPTHNKVLYVPEKILAFGRDDVSREECQTDSGIFSLISQKQLQEDTHQHTDDKMPDRPNAGEDMAKRPVYPENQQRKEFSKPNAEGTSEYTDGTTRPVFKKRIKKTSAKRGERAQLQCVVSGSPLPKILWLKNNRPLKTSDGCEVKVEEDGTNTLIIPSASDDDVGIYTARAMNVNGSIMSSADFTLTDGAGAAEQPVLESPMDMDFTTPAYFFEMSSCQVSEGRLARFDCRVVAYPRPEIVWMRDGKVLEAQDRFRLLNFNNEIYSLLIQDVTLEDTGRYTCWARNKFGEAMTEAYLNVIGLTQEKDDGDVAPKFLTRFYDQQTTEGTGTSFQCMITGRPQPSVTWVLDEKEVDEGRNSRMKNREGVVSLDLTKLKVEQSGLYTCQLSNPLGDAICSARLTVLEDKLRGKMLPKFLKKFDHINAKEGEEAKFTSVIVGEPKPQVTWLFDHKPISDSNRRFVQRKDGDSYTLVLRNVRFDDTGRVTCKAVNEEGEVYCSANLHVRESRFGADTPERTESDAKFGYVPTFTRRLHDVEVKEGTGATFECNVMGIPEPEIAWMKDGRVVTRGGRYHMTSEGGTCKLVIDNVSPQDAGVYTCIISNAQGKSSSTAALKLKTEAPKEKTPERRPKLDLEERTSRKDRYSPEKRRGRDEELGARPKRPLTTKTETDRYEAKPRKPYESLISSRRDDTYIPRRRGSVDSAAFPLPRRRGSIDSQSLALAVYESPIKPYESTRSYETPIKPYESTRSYETPIKPYESTRSYETPSILDRPRSLYDSPKAYETPKSYDRPRAYESPLPFELPKAYEAPKSYERKKKAYQRSKSFEIPQAYESPYAAPKLYESPKAYESPKSYETVKYAYESPKTYESPYDRYESPSRQYDSLKRTFDRPRSFERPRSYSFDREITPAVTVKAVPKMPREQPSFINKREDSVRLSWLPAPIYDLPEEARRVSYIVESREIPSQIWTKLATAIPSTTYIAKHLRPDKEYEFRVRAQNQHGASEPTRMATLDRRIDDSKKALELPEMRVPPRLPTQKPIVTDLGEETVRLAWKPAESYTSKRAPPVSYRLEAKELPGKDWMPMSSRLRDTTHYLSDLPSDRDFMIRVRAENDYGISEPTDSLWLPRATAFPGVPVGRPQIVDVEDTRAKLSWNRVDIPSFGTRDSHLIYMLEVEEPPTRDWRTIARDLDNTEYVVEGLKPGKEYKFRVRAKTMTGIVSEPSPAASLYTTLARSRAPVDRLEVLKYEPDDRSVQLAWHRMHIPPYAADEEPLMYMIEHQELPLPDWKPLVTGIPTTRYRVRNLDAERDYNFRIRALTPYGISPPSPALPVNLRQTPSAIMPLPEAVIISEVQPESVRLTWRRPMHDLGQPISYRVEMLEPPFSDWRPIATRVSETTYKVTGLRPTKDYQFRVIPQVDSGYLPATPSAALTTLPVRPRLPLTEPKLRELSPESVQLSWRPAEYPAYQRTHTPIYYRVEMCDMPGSTWIPVARRLPDCSYNVTGLSPDRAYKFRIVAETDSGYSEPSLPCVLNRMPVPVFSTNEPYITNITQNVVHLGWQAATTPDPTSQVSYMVEVQSPPGIALWSTLQSHHPTPNIRLADLRPDLDYLVRVRAQCGNYTSEPTLPVYIPRRAAPPRMPLEEPYAVDIGSDYIKLQWRSAELPPHILDYAPITYKIEAQDQPGGNWATIAHGIPHTDFKVTGLNPQKAYSFRVRAENDYGLSDATRAMNVQKRSVPPFLPPEQPLMFDLGPGSTRLSWRPATLPSYVPATSPITYAIYIQELPFKSWRPLVRGIPHTTYHITGLNPDKEYMFRIQAENQYGNSPPSESVHLPKLAASKEVVAKTDMLRPISVPEVSDFDEARTSLKLRWKPTPSPHFDTTKHGKYTVETWEPHRHEWKPVAAGIRDTSYQITELPRLPENVFRVRMDTDLPTLSQPSLPVSFSRHSAMMPLFRPQLYELDNDTVRLSWQPIHLPEGVSRRSVRYTVEQRELPEMRWLPVNMDLTETNTKLRGLRPKSDYEFRVKPIIDGKSQEPSLPVSLFRRAVVPKIKFETPEVYDVNDTSLSLRWNTVDVPAFGHDDNPLVFVIERQTLPGYDWQPIATNITDRRYTVTDLQPYQDYNFRVRGICPSGFTEPSPYVPVYRRPSEFNMLGVDDRSRIRMSELPSQKHVLDQSLMIKTLQASVPSTYIRKPRAMSPPMDRRYSSPNIFAASAQQSAAEAAAAYRKGSVTDPRFKREQAYVYSRGRSPMKKSEQFKLPQLPEDIKVVKPDRSNDLYEWYLRQRRNSDVGLADLRRVRSPGAAQEFESRGRRYDLINESTMYRRPSLSPIPQRQPLSVPMEGTNKNPSVADRYEDIKTPYITGQWAFPRRHSIAIDQDAYVKIQRLQHQVKTAQQANLEKRRMSRADIDLIPRSPEDYFAGQSFLVEDEVNFRGMRPIIAGDASKHRSMSQEWNPGYFIVDKFTVSLAGTKKPKPRFTTVEVPYTPPQQPVRARATSADIPHPRPTPRTDISHSRTTTRTRSMTPDLHTRGYTPDFSDMRRALHTRSTSVLNDLESSKQRRPSYSKIARDMSPRTEPASYASALEVPFRRRATSLSRDYVKPRSYSISGPSYDRKFNKTVEDSKTMINKYAHTTQRTAERLTQSREQSIARATSVAPTSKYRSMSVADIRSDSRYSSTPRGSTASTRPPLTDVKSDSRFTTHTRRSVSTSSSDVKSDPRYTTMSRSSISTTHSETKSDPRYSTTHRGSGASARPSIGDLKSDPRYTTQVRGSLSTVPEKAKRGSLADTNDDLKAKLAALTQKLAMDKSKKSVRPVMKFKSSRGEGYIVENK